MAGVIVHDAGIVHDVSGPHPLHLGVVLAAIPAAVVDDDARGSARPQCLQEAARLAEQRPVLLARSQTDAITKMNM
eukprot:1127516-Pyramimonas_sp.AAC.1